MKKYSSHGNVVTILAVIALTVIVTCAVTGCSTVNTNNDPHFDDAGNLLKDSLGKPFKMQDPQKINFYVEVSGSMNGFFRANQQTYFKSDLWNILSYFAPISTGVNVLTNEGNEGAHFSHEDFRTMMNTGSFMSTVKSQPASAKL